MSTLAAHSPLPAAVPGLRRVATVAKQLALLWAISIVVNALVATVHFPVPGNAVAILAMFALLQFRVLRVEMVTDAASLLVRHLTIFFVPFGVGIVGLRSVSGPEALTLTLVLVASASIGIVASGLTAQWLRKGEM